MSEYKQKALFYNSLAGLLENGISMNRALTFRFPSKCQRICKKIKLQIENGATFTEAARSTKAFTSYELCTFLSGERMANLPTVMRTLADWYQELANARSELISDCAYPVLMFYLAQPILYIKDVYTGSMPLETAMFNVLKVWIGFPLLLFAISKLISFVSRSSIVAEILEVIPVFGNLFYLPDTVRYFNALSTGISAGLSGEILYPLAASCCRNGAYRQKFTKVGKCVLENHMSYAQAFSQFSCAKDEARFIPGMLASGEVVGRMDEMALKIAKSAAFDLSQLRKRVFKAVTVLAILVYAGFMFAKIMTAWMDCINQLIDQI